jgi:hypothetical protein
MTELTAWNASGVSPTAARCLTMGCCSRFGAVGNEGPSVFWSAKRLRGCIEVPCSAWESSALKGRSVMISCADDDEGKVVTTFGFEIRAPGLVRSKLEVPGTAWESSALKGRSVMISCADDDDEGKVVTTVVRTPGLVRSIGDEVVIRSDTHNF